MDSKQSAHLPSLETISKANIKTLRGLYEALEGAPPPPALKQGYLRLHLGWIVQARQQNDDPGPIRERLLKKVQRSEKSPTLSYSPGTRLVREWQGQTHEVTILESGYLYQGQTYQSLSKIANEITGAHWSGPKFFRMKKKKSPK